MAFFKITDFVLICCVFLNPWHLGRLEAYYEMVDFVIIFLQFR